MATSLSVITRKCLRCPIFGAPRDLSGTVLPTFEDIMKYHLYVRNDLKVNPKSNGPTVSAISELVSLRAENIWMKASIPIVSHSRVLQLVRSYTDRYKKLLKSYK